VDVRSVNSQLPCDQLLGDEQLAAGFECWHGVEAQSPYIEVGVDPLLARPVGLGLNSRDRLGRHLAGLDELGDGTLELDNERSHRPRERLDGHDHRAILPRHGPKRLLALARAHPLIRM
jgi:hypothetical protein